MSWIEAVRTKVSNVVHAGPRFILLWALRIVLEQCIGSGSSATLSSDMLWIEVWLLLRAPRHVWYCSVPVGPSLLTSHATTTSLLTSDSTACLPMDLLWVCVYVTVPLESILLFPVSTDSRGVGVGVGSLWYLGCTVCVPAAVTIAPTSCAPSDGGLKCL